MRAYVILAARLLLTIPPLPREHQSISRVPRSHTIKKFKSRQVVRSFSTILHIFVSRFPLDINNVTILISRPLFTILQGRGSDDVYDDVSDDVALPSTD